MSVDSTTKTRSRFSEPAYSRIQADMRKRIRDGRWRPGEMLPGRLELSREYSVSLVTLQRAVADLLDDGTFTADGRRGTYVTDEAPGIVARIDSEPQRDRVSNVDAPRIVATVGIVTSIDEKSSGNTGYSNHWLASIVRAAEEAFLDAGSKIVVVNRNRGGKKLSLQTSIAEARNKGVDAIAFLELNPIGSEIGAIYDDIEQSPLPFICTSGDQISPPLSHVTYDSRQAGYQAAWHLIRQGCRRFVFFAPFAARWSEERLLGARQALRDAGFGSESLAVFPDNPKEIAGYPLFSEVAADSAAVAFESGAIAEGVIAQNDHVAGGVIDAGLRRGVRPGTGYAIVGFDDVVESMLYGLTTMRPPLEEMGRVAACSLLQSIAGGAPVGHVRLSSRLIERSSSQWRKED